MEEIKARFIDAQRRVKRAREDRDEAEADCEKLLLKNMLDEINGTATIRIERVDVNDTTGTYTLVFNNGGRVVKRTFPLVLVFSLATGETATCSVSDCYRGKNVLEFANKSIFKEMFLVVQKFDPRWEDFAKWDLMQACSKYLTE